MTIRPFRSGDEEAFKSLNLEWIERYFTLEPKDEEALDDPQSTILDRGGRILMAQQAGATVGTCALAVLDERTVELAKMAAAPAARGRGVGFALGRAAITAAREMGAHRIYLETNSRLSAAVTLYRRLGFRPANGPPSPYERCDTQMELALI